MAAPVIQIYYNDAEVKIMWLPDLTGVYSTFNLYWSALSTMVGEVAIKTLIPNVAGSFYSDKHIITSFKRADIGLTTSNEFYLRLKGVSAGGVEDGANPGPTRYIQSLLEIREEFHSAQIYGFDYDRNMWKKVAVGYTGGVRIA